jgi:hypothetical protein
MKLESLTEQLKPVIDRCIDKVLFPTMPIQCFDTTPSTGNALYEYLIGGKSYSYSDVDGFVETRSFTMSNPDTVMFHRSTYNEFIALLEQINTQKDKFPLIFLNSPTIEFSFKGEQGYATIGQIVIATSSLHNLTSDIREIQSFKFILRPLYNLFIESLFAYGFLTQDVEIKAKEHFFYGKDDKSGTSGHLFCDYVDAIEIKNLKIKLKQIC